jgi:hypothetical protein
MRKIIRVTQIAFTHLAIKFRNKLSAIPTCCDNAQFVMTDADKFL